MTELFGLDVFYVYFCFKKMLSIHTFDTINAYENPPIRYRYIFLNIGIDSYL